MPLKHPPIPRTPGTYTCFRCNGEIIITEKRPFRPTTCKHFQAQNWDSPTVRAHRPATHYTTKLKCLTCGMTNFVNEFGETCLRTRVCGQCKTSLHITGMRAQMEALPMRYKARRPIAQGKGKRLARMLRELGGKK